MLVLQNMDELIDDLDVPSDWIAASHACTCNPCKFKHYPADWYESLRLVQGAPFSPHSRIPENCAHTAAVRLEGITYPPQISDSTPRTYGLLNSGLVVLHP